MKAEESKETEEKFRIGFEREEQKCKEMNEKNIKEAQIVTELKENFTSCKENLEVIIKNLTGDTDVSRYSYKLNNPNCSTIVS